MKQTQWQVTQQRLGLTQHMRNSLSLLTMGHDEICSALGRERRRNPFLRSSYLPDQSAQIRHDIGENAAITAIPPATDNLTSQIAMIKLAPPERKLACDLVHCLDERGFFTDSADDMSGYLEASADKIIAIVETLQTMVEPAGVFAWSLKDSFRIQLQAQNRYDPMIAELLMHLDLIAAQNVDAICDILAVDHEDAQDMLDDIRKLTPAPLMLVADVTSIHQAADLIVRLDGNGAIDVELNEAALPALLTDDALFSSIKTTETDKMALAYYRDCYRSAGTFVLAMQKRANTLLRLGNELANVQARFLKTGKAIDRKPLTMGRLAAKLGLNKSTISRALNNCLIETPHGLIPALDFFVRPLADGAEHKTRQQALARLSTLIKTEDVNHPYSDDVLAGMMSKTSFVISRRTVAKYRKMLNIPNAFARRSARQR